MLESYFKWEELLVGVYCRTTVTDPSCPRSAGVVVVINDIINHGGRMGGPIGGYLRVFSTKSINQSLKIFL